MSDEAPTLLSTGFNGVSFAQESTHLLISESIRQYFPPKS